MDPASEELFPRFIREIPMFQNWPLQIGNIFRQRKLYAARRSSRFCHCRENYRSGALISHLEVLESRQMLTNLVAVNLVGATLHLTDISSPNQSTGDNFSVSYTASQVVLTGTNGTSFQVGGQTLSSYTLSVSSPISIFMALSHSANAVTLTGDGTASLSNLIVNLGSGQQANTFSLTKVIADSVILVGGGDNSSVTFSQSQIQENVIGLLGFQAGDILDFENTTVSGNVIDHVGKLVMNQSTISGRLVDVELGSGSIYNTTNSNYNNVLVIMGRGGVANYMSTSGGTNHTYGRVTYIGRHSSPIQINLGTGSTTNNIPATWIFSNQPRLINVHCTAVQGAPSSSLTVNNLAAATTTPTITGTYSSQNNAVLTVNVNGTTYTLGKDSQLTSPSTGQWSLNLTGAALPTTTTTFTVTATTTDDFGNKTTATGTVTNEQAIISKYVTAQNLTSSNVVTTSGLNYDITTTGTGALPTAGQTLAVTYTGYLLNSDGTLGSEFDSNTDGTHPSDPNPFTFVLGKGQVIKGWDEAFALLPVGSSATLIIPSSLAYGTTGSGTSVPANSILVFKVTLISAVTSGSTLTVKSLAAPTTTPTITGTYSTTNFASLTVNVNGVTYTLGTSPQLTSPSTGTWSLNLTGSPLSTSTTSFAVTAVMMDSSGGKSTATGTVTNEQAIISKYVTAQSLTASNVVTSSGLNYDITTHGSGAVPTAGKTLAVTYTGYLLNSDGTQGSEFDSNTDGTHPSDPNPFTFVLGAGQVIKGWDEAFALLPVGSVATLIIPSALAYGTTGSGTSIPPNSILVFKVTLISAT